MTLFSYFVDPVLRGPTIGSMLMCLVAALIGSIGLLRKQSLIGEALSHAAYPGVILGVMIAGILSIGDNHELGIAFLIMSGAFCTALIGLWAIQLLETKLSISSDSALCFILSAFFGIGVTLASHVQFTHTALYKQAQTYLYGQAATMVDSHIYLYGILALIVIVTMILIDKELRAVTFNPDYARSLGINVRAINLVIFILTAFAVVIGIRSVGVVLMSAMLIIPAAAARQYTNRFHVMLILAACFGIASGFFGNYFSVELTNYLADQYPKTRLAVPTGPTIVLVAATICVFSLLFAPQRGMVLRWIRALRFRHQCLRENLLKAIWRIGPEEQVTLEQIAKQQSINKIYLHFLLIGLVYSGWLEKLAPDTYKLSPAGKQRAAQIVRLHRLWEVYLANYLGVGIERVHRNAEEIEHIITPEIERELTALLHDPQVDPHQQIIPRGM